MLVSLFVLSAISSAKAKLESEPLSPGFELQALEKLLRIEMKLDDHSGEFETLKTRIEECAAAQNQISSTAGKHHIFIIVFIIAVKNFYIYFSRKWSCFTTLIVHISGARKHVRHS